MFIDKARIFITAGRGGDGSISFRREKYVAMGGPDGGNGGKGGDIYLVADPHMTTLLDLTYKPHYRVDNGMPGASNNCTGRSSEDLVLKVPLGTVVYKNNEIIADLKEPGQLLLAAKGGRGGRGNSSFKTMRHTAPRIAEKGEPGEDISLDLELKLIADVGLVGFPNAGKSTFLSRVSAARPKIADYPFTTLAPNLGVARVGERNFVIADIPGLIEGAHEGRGIGDEFLRHVQRTRVLIHVVDISGFDNKTPYQNFRIINQELEKFSKELAHKPMVIIVNKMDIPDADKALSQFKRHLRGKKIYPVSAVTGEGIKDALNAVLKVLAKPDTQEPAIPEPVKKYVYEPEFTITKDDDVFVLTGTKVERLAAMSDFGQEESVRRFQNILKKMGVDKALEEQGIAEGDTVRIGMVEFYYQR